MLDHKHPISNVVLKLSDGNIGLAMNVVVLSKEEATELGNRLIEASKPSGLISIPSFDGKGLKESKP